MNRGIDDHHPSHNVSYATPIDPEAFVSAVGFRTQRRSVAFFTRGWLLFRIFEQFHAPNPPSKEEIDAF